MQNSEIPNNPPDLSKGTPPANPNETPGAPPSSTPPPSHYSPGTPPGNVPPSAPVSTNIIGQAWSLLQPQIGMWIVAVLIYGAVSGAFQGVSVLVSAAGGQDPSAIIKLLSGIISIAAFLIGLLANAGLMKMAIHQVRSGQAEISKLFDIMDVIAPVLIAGIVVTIATALGFVACIIPGVIIALGFSMYIPLIVDKKEDAITSIKRSWEACKPHLGALFVLYLLLGLINIAGFCACGLGFFVTYPLTQIAIALTYRNLFGVGQDGSTMAPQSFPPPPIASPQ